MPRFSLMSPIVSEKRSRSPIPTSRHHCHYCFVFIRNLSGIYLSCFIYPASELFHLSSPSAFTFSAAAVRLPPPLPCRHHHHPPAARIDRDEMFILWRWDDTIFYLFIYLIIFHFPEIISTNIFHFISFSSFYFRNISSCILYFHFQEFLLLHYSLWFHTINGHDELLNVWTEWWWFTLLLIDFDYYYDFHFLFHVIAVIDTMIDWLITLPLSLLFSFIYSRIF